MKLQDIYIRDPYVLAYDGVYYMYGKTKVDELNFYVYTSKNLTEWSTPKKVFTPPADFWADRDFWAPEVHIYNGKFYMLASFKSENHCRGTQILVSDKPDGEFELLTDKPITPQAWECLDGTLYVDKKGKPHMIFCHEWTQIGDGTVCEIELSKDLKTSVTQPRVLWHASDKHGVINAVENIESKVTDGPFLYRTGNGDLICIWSSFNKNGYAELISRSDNGDIDGNWSIDETPLFEKNGGHGMIFETFEGKHMFVMHSPNENPNERAVMYRLSDDKFELTED